MPKIEALYYPNLEPPLFWLKSILLFFDSITTIIPEDSDTYLSNDYKKFRDQFPDCIKSLSPTEEDITLEEVNIHRLRKAFNEIKLQNKDLNKIFEVQIADGQILYPGRAYIHNQKLTEEIKNLLFEYDLVEYKFQLLSGMFGIQHPKNFMLMNEDASDLILSLIAENISKQYGFSTITDLDLGYISNFLNSNNIDHKPLSNSLLISSIINFEIPSVLEYVDLKSYKELKSNYQDIKELFQRFLIDVNSIYHLDSISDELTLAEKLHELIIELDNEIIRFKKTKYAKNITKWTPIGIGGLVSLGSAILNSPEISISAAGVSFIIQIIQNISTKSYTTSNKQNFVSILANLQKDILRKSKICRLI